MNTHTVALFAAVAAALHAAHHVADHWVQTDHQARTKGLPGRAGRLACIAHVATYTLTALIAFGLLHLYTGLALDPWPTAAGLAVSAITHYVADRREPLRRIATALGSGAYYQVKEGGINGAFHLDQSWHTGWLFLAALTVASGTRGLGFTAVLSLTITGVIVAALARGDAPRSAAAVVVRQRPHPDRALVGSNRKAG